MLRKLIGFTNIFENNLLDKLEFNGNSNTNGYDPGFGYRR
jgi:hypothetical protein